MTVAAALAAIACICYAVVRHELRTQIDNALRAQVAAIKQGDFRSLNEQVTSIPASAGGPAPYVQVVTSSGDVYSQLGGLRLPVRTPSTAGNQVTLWDASVQGNALRAIVFAPRFLVNINGEPAKVTIELARPLDGIDRILTDLRLVLLLLVAGGVAVVAIMSRVSARRVLRPLSDVAAAAQHITETQDLTTQISVGAADEVGQLASRFNSMITQLNRSHQALDAAVHSQRQLIADASHELRTPVTSLRTNLEVLELADTMDPLERQTIIGDMREQTEELGVLLTDLIELARGDSVELHVEDIRLDTLVETCVRRAQRDFPHHEFQLIAVPVLIEGVEDRLTRAVDNLLRNAALHGDADQPVEVTVDEDGLTVRDHGRGINPDDLPHLFERFYRSVDARSQPGTGLGLAIVHQIAEQHAATVTANNAPSGGAVFAITFRQITPATAIDALSPE